MSVSSNAFLTTAAQVPFYLAFINGAMLGTEVLNRICAVALPRIGFSPSKSKPRLYQHLSTKQLLIQTISFCAIGILGAACIERFLGPPHPFFKKMAIFSHILQTS